MPLKNKVFLASKSPRRREIISQVFNNISFIDAPLDEPRWQQGQAADDYLRLGLAEKFRVGTAAIDSPETDSLLLVADTIVVLGREVLGKPVDAVDARAMLQKLSGKAHTVPTGIQLGIFRDGRWKISTHIEVSRVTFRSLSRAEIRRYVASGEPMDKAGAYGFQAKGLQLVDRISGSYTNIIGLPVLALERMARDLVG